LYFLFSLRRAPSDYDEGKSRFWDMYIFKFMRREGVGNMNTLGK